MATPTDSTFSSLLTVSLISGTTGAEIYYTTDGTAAGSGSTHYTVPFTLYQTTTLKAVAVKSGLLTSDTLTVNYRLVQPKSTTAKPVLNPPGQRFATSVEILASTSTDSSQIWYTLDGTDPVSSGTHKLYVPTGFILNQSATVKAVTLRNLDSGVTRTSTTETDGRYRFLALAPGRYHLSAQLAGFASKEIADIQLTIGLSLTQDFTMGLQSVQESVTVIGWLWPNFWQLWRGPN